jgi:hypothetical protein
VERRIIEALGTLKETIDARELQRFSDRLELKRRKDAQNNDDLLECMVDRALHGASTHDFELNTISSEEIRSAARQFLPSHKGAYVRLALVANSHSTLTGPLCRRLRSDFPGRAHANGWPTVAVVSQQSCLGRQHVRQPAISSVLLLDRRTVPSHKSNRPVTLLGRIRWPQPLQ